MVFANWDCGAGGELDPLANRKYFFCGDFATGAGPPRMRVQALRTKRKEASRRDPANWSPRCGSLLANKGPITCPMAKTCCHCRNERRRITPRNLPRFLNGDHRDDHKCAAHQECRDNNRRQGMPKRGQRDPNRHEKPTGDPALAIAQALPRARCKKR